MSNPKANLLLIGKQSVDSKQTDKKYDFGKQSARIISVSAKQNALVCEYSMAVFSFVHNNDWLGSHHWSQHDVGCAQ
jgi:hypothetical protein